MARRAVVVIDLQKEYLAGGKLPLHEVDAAVEKGARVIEHARLTGDAVVHIRHEQPSGPIFVPGSDGAWIISSAAPRADEVVSTSDVVDLEDLRSASSPQTG